MPIATILQQPAAGSLQAAYRPIFLQVAATATDGSKQPPYVVCDIYIGGVYYKSMFRTAPDSIGANACTYSFSISDALQEWLQPDLAAIDNAQILPAGHMSANVFCRFRASGKDADGFTVEEGVVPLQGTKFTDPEPGDGTQSNTFFVINAALQHADNPDLALHLASFRSGTWSADAYPLTHRRRYYFSKDSADHYPFAYAGNCLSVGIELCYRLRGSAAFNCTGGADLNPCEAIHYTVEVIGSRVYIHLESAPVSGGKVQARYRLQGDAVWIDGGSSAAKDFYFSVHDAGDYEVEVITFCSCCTSAAPVASTFTIDAAVQNLAWRGINPYCEVVTLPQPVYIAVALRNKSITDQYYPNSTNYYQRSQEENYELWVQFFSDAARLNPLNLVLPSLTVYLRKTTSSTQGGYPQTAETVLPLTVSPNGTEVLWGSITTQLHTDYYDINNENAPTGQADDFYNTYTPFPTAEVVGGNSGKLAYRELQQYNTDSSLPTGITKSNAVGDPDYIAPIIDPASCPAGLPITYVQYGYALEIAKVEFRHNGQFDYATPVNHTGAGGYQYVLSLPKDQEVYLTVKARILDSANKNSTLKVRLSLEDGSKKEYDVPSNIETLLPDVFKAIKSVNISNY